MATLIERAGVMMTLEDAQLYDELTQKIDYFDRLQYCYKIKLNSCYGALLNKHFRFHDSRNGESTTGTGRAILKFMCGRANEIITGVHDPLGEAVIYGDTDSCYFRVYDVVKDNLTHLSKQELLDKTVLRADEIADLINDSFEEFMGDSFLCTGDYAKRIKAGREIVATRGIFVTPKRYMLLVADEEGKRVFDGAPDKLKVMGLDTKKTSLPKYVQVALNNFMGRFLRGEDWEIIAADIVEFKDTMRKSDISLLGLPKAVNKVELYLQTLMVEGEKARLPGHVRAAIYYNMKLDEYGDKASLRISSGMKCRVFYLVRPQGKFKAIAVPTDLKALPAWFDNIRVDVDLQVTKLIDAPLENILRVIGKVPPSKQTMFVDSILEF